MERRLHLIILVSILVTTSCNPSLKLMKEAEQFEQLGLTEDAYDQYQEIYTYYDRPDALAAMTRLAQTHSDNNFAQARIAAQSGYLESAHDQYEAAFNYFHAHERAGIILPLSANQQFADVKQKLTDKYYKEAELLVLEEKYDSAYDIIRKMYAIDRNNEGAAFLDAMCDLMPAYKNGVKAMELGYYRQAYKFLDEASRIDAGFRDIAELKRECMRKGSFTLAYVPLNSDKKQALATMVSSSIKNELLALNDPFMKLVSRDNIDAILNEQQTSMSELFDDKSLVEAGKLLGAQYILTGEVITNQLGIVLSFRYELMNTETGRILISENIATEKFGDYAATAEWIAKQVAVSMKGFTPQD